MPPQVEHELERRSGRLELQPYGQSFTSSMLQRLHLAILSRFQLDGAQDGEHDHKHETDGEQL